MPCIETTRRSDTARTNATVYVSAVSRAEIERLFSFAVYQAYKLISCFRFQASIRLVRRFETAAPAASVSRGQLPDKWPKVIENDLFRRTGILQLYLTNFGLHEESKRLICTAKKPLAEHAMLDNCLQTAADHGLNGPLTNGTVDSGLIRPASSSLSSSGLPQERHHQHRGVVALRQGQRMVQTRQDQMQALPLGQALQMSG